MVIPPHHGEDLLEEDGLLKLGMMALLVYVSLSLTYFSTFAVSAYKIYNYSISNGTGFLESVLAAVFLGLVIAFIGIKLLLILASGLVGIGVYLFK